MASKKKTKQPPRPNAFPKRQWAAILTIAALAGAALWISRSRGPEPTSATISVTHSSQEPGQQQNDFSQYAGSASCKECHTEIYQKWIVSNHGQAERSLTPGDNKAFQPNRIFQHGSQHTEIRLSGTQRDVIALGLSGTYETHSIARVIGNSPLRQFLVPAPGGRFQTLEASYDPLRDEWFNVYGTEDRQPGEWGHWTGRGMTWNTMCANCHNTRLRKNYTESSDSFATTMAEPTVGCEACHGPMKSHVAWSKSHRNGTDPTIRKLSSEQVFETCAQCHSRRMELTGDFVPGDSFHDHHALSIVDQSDIFHPDGQVRDEDYEYSAFLGSKMHAAGIRCVNCHDPHTAKVRLPGNLMCLSCHSGGYQNAPKIDPSTHSFHKIDPLYAAADPVALARRDPAKVAGNGGECINCHMPQTMYMQRHRRHDHGFTIPDPLLTKRFGIPNACNRCHTDKDPDWALNWTTQWYGSKMERPSRTRAELFASAKTGDPEALKQLVPILSGTEAAYWKAAAAGLLGLRPELPSVVPALVNATKDPSPLVRANAVRALGGGVGDEQVKKAIKELLQDPIRAVRFSAEWALRGDLAPDSVAGTELGKILQFTADQPTGQMQMGAYFISRNEPEKAVSHYQKAVEWDPRSAPIRRDYAVVLSMLNQTQKAVEQLQVACQLEPQNPELHYNLALAWNEAGNTKTAIEELKNTVKLDPTQANAWYNLGLALNGEGQIQQSLDALEHGAQAAPNDPRIPYAQATILARSGQLPQARAAAQRALEIQPAFGSARQLLDQLEGK